MPEGVAGAALRSHLVESLLEPSKIVRPEYRGVTVVDHDGRSATGIIVRDAATELVLCDATTPGTEIVIDKTTIDDRSDLAVSLMPAGLANLLTGRGQFLDLIAYLEAVAKGGADAAAALEPDPALLARSAPPAYEQEIDHAGFVAEWSDPEAARGALERGAAIYGRVCANCHGTLEAPGSLPTAPRFASHTFKRGADPLSLYSTLTVGAGLMVPQGWMVPSQKYDVIHYLRETFLKGHNDKALVAITPDYLAALPKGTSRGPAPSATDPWRLHDYGPFLAATIEVGRDHGGIVRKGFSVRLDPGGEGIGRGRAFAIHDLDTLSRAGMWTGDGFIDWEGINFDGRHGAHPHTVGDVQWFPSEGPGWADPATGSFDDPRGLGRDGRPFGPIPWARMRSVHHAGDTILLDYRVGDAPILETVRLEPVSVAAADGSALPRQRGGGAGDTGERPRADRQGASGHSRRLSGPRDSGWRRRARPRRGAVGCPGRCPGDSSRCDPADRAGLHGHRPAIAAALAAGARDPRGAGRQRRSARRRSALSPEPKSLERAAAPFWPRLSWARRRHGGRLHVGR
jgi:putative heme-binding domain-containing protein